MVVATSNSIQSEKILRIELPVVDLSAGRSTVTKLILKASEEYGFFNVINHGVPQNTMTELEEAGFNFFAKPLSQKNKVIAKKPFGYGNKIIGINGDMGDLEFLLLNASPSPNSINAPLFKIISNDPSKFSSIVSAYTEAVRKLACEILEIMAEGLGVPDKCFFSKLIRSVDSDSLLRLNHYPPLKDNKDSIGFGPHTDPQILTLLRSNAVGGLQISLQDGVWIPVSPNPSAFCVNVGDLLQVMTNGRFVSVRHRAVVSSNKNGEKGRMSVAFFGGPPLDASIFAPPVMLTPKRPSLLYKTFTWDEYKKVVYSLCLGESRLLLFSIGNPNFND